MSHRPSLICNGDPTRSLVGAPAGSLAVVGENLENHSKFDISEKEILFSSSPSL